MPHLVAITGPLGAGKTTLASILAWRYKLAVEALGGNIQLFSNYDLYGSERLREAEDWFKVAEAHGSICVWDEAHRSFDSRKHSTLQNILATEILTFARKMAAIQIFVTPSITRLDTRIRELIEVLIVVRPAGHGAISFDFYDFQADWGGTRFGKFLHNRFLPGGKVKKIHGLELFDSHSFVNGFPLPTTEPAAKKFMAELERRHDAARLHKELRIS